MNSNLKNDYNVLNSKIDIIWDENKKIYMNGAVEEMDIAYYSCGYRILKLVHYNGIEIIAYRGILAGYEDITAQWKNYRKILLEKNIRKEKLLEYESKTH